MFPADSADLRRFNTQALNFNMNKILFSVYRVLVPKPLRTRILKKNLRRKILAHFADIPDDKINEDQKEVINYLMNNPVSIFPYPFQNMYLSSNVEVLSDSETGMKYVNQDGKRLYFKKRWNKKRIQKGYSELSKEQDAGSPHRYITDDFSPGSDDVLADIGAAEGNFSLSVIEKVRKVYLFEYDHGMDRSSRENICSLERQNRDCSEICRRFG